MVGAALGGFDSLVNRASFVADPATTSPSQQVARFLSYLLNAGWAWAAVAVLAGWWVGTQLLAAAAGWLSVSAAVVAYYVTDSRVRAEELSSHGGENVLWLLACVLVCAPLGLAGA